jgi:hypothetical protein
VEPGFFAVAGLGLALLSLMIVIRLTSVGVNWKRTALAVVELWIVVAAWVGMASYFSYLRKTPALGIISLALVLALVVHFMFSLSRLRGEQG